MEFDIVIATRNRREALSLSVPLMLSQTRLPGQLIVVDSSDDHDAVQETVEKAAERASSCTQIKIIRSAPGSSFQRNLGLRYVKAPVVLFPDDDALWFPGVGRAIMRVYERDTDGSVGGVGAFESPVPPPGVFDSSTPLYRMEFRDRLQLSIGRFLDSLEYRFFPDPFFMEASCRCREKEMPKWLPEEQAVPASLFPGFRMSFRTGLIAGTGFDESLGRYALFEDYDACLTMLQRHILVDTANARVFHYRSPEKRVDGIEWGVLQVLNRAYIICKHSRPGSPARRRLKAFLYYKTLRYLLQTRTGYGRARVKGTLRALPMITRLLEAPLQQLPQSCLALRRACMSGTP
jgi:glycosyltransferase involved in cell wall biosynthesis